MTGLDTNVLVRFVMADDKSQSAKARALIQSFTAQSPGFITLVCLAELVWVLRSKYRQPKSKIVHWLDRFLEASEFAIESQAAVVQATKAYSGGSVQFSDCLIERTGHAAGCLETVTFDQDAAKSTGMHLL